MSSLVARTVLWAFLPIAIASLRTLGTRRGILVSLLGGWLFLPTFSSATVTFPLLHSKPEFLATMILAACIVTDPGPLRRLRPRVLDLPFALLALLPYVTALENDLGTYEAASALAEGLGLWAFPYLLGRAYLGSWAALADLGRATVAAGLVYVPFCLWEVRMSPMLHQQVYGYSTFQFDQAIRFGGYRPSVFMSHGLQLSLFMACCTVVAYWLWRCGERAPVLRLRVSWAFAVLAGTTLLCKSTGATILLAVGMAALEATRRLRAGWPVWALLALFAAYPAARIAGWSGERLVQAAAVAVNRDRADSLEFRLRNENLLVAKALQRPLLGWGRWGRSRVYDEYGSDVAVTDGLWVITLGISGVIALAALGLAVALPSVLLLRRFPVRLWSHPQLAPAAALAVTVLLWGIDGLSNAFLNPVVFVSAGAVAGFATAPRARRRRAPLGREAGLPRGPAVGRVPIQT